MESWSELADDVAAIERRVNDAIFSAVREQLGRGEPESAKERERQLSRVRRSLQKAEQLLRGSEFD